MTWGLDSGDEVQRRVVILPVWSLASLAGKRFITSLDWNVLKISHNQGLE